MDIKIVMFYSEMYQALNISTRANYAKNVSFLIKIVNNFTELFKKYHLSNIRLTSRYNGYSPKHSFHSLELKISLLMVHVVQLASVQSFSPKPMEIV